MIALISDVHANIEALEAVVEDIKKHKVDFVYCLGDVIGYGPDPRACMGIVKELCEFTLCGNHEEAVLFNAEDFHPKARKAIEWTRRELNSKNYAKSENYALWDFLGKLRKKLKEDSNVFVHASPRRPTREYVLPKDIKDQSKLKAVFAEFKDCNICFAGHTHIPGIFTEDYRFYYSKTIGNKIDLDTIPGKKLINIGSVGQPRDGDNRACYVLFDKNKIKWKRIEYNYKSTMEKIRKVDGLAEYLATRLENGK